MLSKKKMVWFLAFVLLLTQSLFVGAVDIQTTSNERIFGNDRYETAVAISQEGWESSDVVVLARGDNFADALCAGPLAYLLNGPDRKSVV